MARPPIPLSERRQRFAPIARFATVLLMLGMFIATHIPPGTLPHHVSHIDKLLHCLVYLALTFSVLTSWELTVGQLRPQHYFTVWLVGTLYGAIDEITQIPVGRHAEWPYQKRISKLTRKISSVVGRQDYARVTVDGDTVAPIAIAGASVLSSTSRADGFVIVPADSEGYPPGTDVDVYFYDCG